MLEFWLESEKDDISIFFWKVAVAGLDLLSYYPIFNIAFLNSPSSYYFPFIQWKVEYKKWLKARWI